LPLVSEVRRFACTQCGRCCNRAPEVELSEAGELADLFVFRLMFRLYRLPRLPQRNAPGGSETFFQKKRLLAHHAARQYSRKVMRDGRAVEHICYLMVSALAMDTRPGSCAALERGRCSIHDRRPLACRSVPLHYSRVESLALSDFDSFVGTQGFECDTSANAAPVLIDGRIVDPEMLQARADADSIAGRDRRWKEAIARNMKPGRSERGGLPSLHEVEANAHLAAMTSSMRIAWEIAAQTGLINDEQACALGRLQLATIERELASGTCSPTEFQTLLDMRADYSSST
jgi:Fe-S-cluster containining protein